MPRPLRWRDTLTWLATSRAEREFGFKVKTPFEVGLKRTVECYLEQRRQGAFLPATERSVKHQLWRQ